MRLWNEKTFSVEQFTLFGVQYLSKEGSYVNEKKRTNKVNTLALGLLLISLSFADGGLQNACVGTESYDVEKNTNP